MPRIPARKAVVLVLAALLPVAGNALSTTNSDNADLVLADMKSALDELVVTDTIPLSAAAKQSGRIRQLSVAGLLAETIRRIRDEDSVSSLYLD